MNKDLDILKAILLEAEGDEKEVKKNDAEEKADDRANEKADKPDSSFDKDPMGFISQILLKLFYTTVNFFIYPIWAMAYMKLS